ncbi:DUF4280 domain-containing protein [Tepidibacter mesophilus]|uniref:DUF4280 domain-containing protein n=1 Tax=Tepidibacter mesophilus TaxID=655607 RepID=UPI001650FC2D|nr:DUF4280 domain-containing protein [Tepidibacter mesophilus]
MIGAEIVAAGIYGAIKAVTEKPTSYVVHGATIQCSCGLRLSNIVVQLSHGEFIHNMPQLNIGDSKPNENILSFGGCTSPENPAVKAAAEKIMKEVQEREKGFMDRVMDFFCKKPKEEVNEDFVKKCAGECIPIIKIEWEGGKEDVLVEDKMALLTTSTLSCIYGGNITIIDNGQEQVEDAMESPPPSLDENSDGMREETEAYASRLKEKYDLSEREYKVLLGLNVKNLRPRTKAVLEKHLENIFIKDQKKKKNSLSPSYYDYQSGKAYLKENKSIKERADELASVVSFINNVNYIYKNDNKSLIEQAKYISELEKYKNEKDPTTRVYKAYIATNPKNRTGFLVNFDAGFDERLKEIAPYGDITKVTVDKLDYLYRSNHVDNTKDISETANLLAGSLLTVWNAQSIENYQKSKITSSTKKSINEPVVEVVQKTDTSYEQSVDNFMNNTENFNVKNIYTKSVDEIAQIFKDSGYNVRIEPSKSGKATMIRIDGMKGPRTINTIQVHNGGGRHGLDYIKVKGNNVSYKIVNGSSSEYIGNPELEKCEFYWLKE